MKDAKAIIVKIIHPWAWYDNKVGQHARVIEHDGKYIIEGNYYRSDHTMFIRKEDAEVMS